jgi:hypothetical protein
VDRWLTNVQFGRDTNVGRGCGTSYQYFMCEVLVVVVFFFIISPEQNDFVFLKWFHTEFKVIKNARTMLFSMHKFIFYFYLFGLVVAYRNLFWLCNLVAVAY